jgi:hypothetical protein
VRPNGTIVSTLADPNGVRFPHVSPDGQQVVYLGGGGLGIAPTRGGPRILIQVNHPEPYALWRS